MKINTKNNPEFLELGTKHNDQIILMKQMESTEMVLNATLTFVIIQALMVAVICGVVIFQAID